MTDAYRNLDFILNKLEPLGIRDPLLAKAWNLREAVKRHRKQAEDRTEAQRVSDQEAALGLEPFYSENISKMVALLLKHVPNAISELQNQSAAIKAEWSRAFQMASVENSKSSSGDEDWDMQYEVFEKSYTKFQNEESKATKTSPGSKDHPDVVKLEQALGRWALVHSSSPIAKELEKSKKNIEAMMEFRARWNEIQESFRAPVEAMLESVKELIVDEPSAAHHHHQKDPLNTRAHSYAALQEQLEFLLEDETSPLNARPNWTSVSAHGTQEMLRSFEATKTHFFAILKEDLHNLMMRHHVNESVVPVAPVTSGEPEIELADTDLVHRLDIEIQSHLDIIKQIQLKFSQRDTLIARMEGQLAHLKPPVTAEAFQQLKDDFSQAQKEFKLAANKAFYDRYQRINQKNKRILDDMVKKNNSPDTQAALDRFKALYQSCLNDLQRRDILNGNSMLNQESSLARRLGEMKEVNIQFQEHHTKANENNLLSTRLENPVYKKVQQLTAALTKLYQKSIPKEEKKFIHDTIFKLEQLAQQYRDDKNRDPAKETQLNQTFLVTVFKTVESRLQQLDSMAEKKQPSTVLQQVGELLKKVATGFKRIIKLEPPKSEALPKSGEAFRELKEALNPTTPMTRNPSKSAR